MLHGMTNEQGHCFEKEVIKKDVFINVPGL